MAPRDYVPHLVVGYLSVRSHRDRSVLQADDLSDYKQFYGDPVLRDETLGRIDEFGFMVLAESRFGFAVAGSKEQWEELNEGRLRTYEEVIYTSGSRVRSVTHVGFEGLAGPVPARIPNTRNNGAIDAIMFERPRATQGPFPSPHPPVLADRAYLTVPDGVAERLGAAGLQARGHDVLVAVIDTGFFRHPYFSAHGYKVEVPLSVFPGTDPEGDPSGHGTGVAANVFAVAPDATVVPIRASNDKGHLVATLAGFMLAKERKPDVITSSWSADYPPDQKLPDLPYPIDRILELEIREAIGSGVVVVFAAGNGTFGVEAQVPGVISAGGVYPEGETLTASAYASGFESAWYEDAAGARVKVPTVCGVVGQPPRAAYLMLPVPDGSRIDMEFALSDNGADLPDETQPFDGWALFSGTSAAAPQVAGAAAVLRGVNPQASPREIAERLCETAIDVTEGHGHERFAHRAAEGPDLATGFGLIDVGRAVDGWPRGDFRKTVVEKEPVPPDFLEALRDQNDLMGAFLQRISVDDAFRERLERDPASAVRELGLKEPYTIHEPIRLAPKSVCQKALEEWRKNRAFDVIETDHGPIARMLC